MNEKEAIERDTADAFLGLYNARMKTSFSITQHSDAPDIRCEDSEGNTLNLEITLTEDRDGDIQAFLGRSDARSIEAYGQHIADVKDKKASPFEWLSCLPGNVTQMLVNRVISKLNRDYGPNVALVVRDTAPLPRHWDRYIDDIKECLSSERNLFDKGIWIITDSKDRIYRIT